jgi:RimJ/RimL family protein N-acetyltransferase
MSIVGWRGVRVRLVPPDRRVHLENALQWMNDPNVTGTIALNLGVARGQEEAFFDQIEKGSDNAFHWAIVAEDDNDRHIGFIDLRGIHWRFRSASGGLLIGDRGAWGKGYATDAVRVRTRFAFEQLGLHRVEGHTMNPAMRRVYEKCGYVREGTLRQSMWRDGRWHDAELYAILDSDYFASR